MAARGINKVILVGNLGQDPEVRYMPDGGAVATITLATSENWRDKHTGENKELTEWHRVVLFGKLAEVAGEYLRKGAQVYIEGQLRTRKWQGTDGQDKYTTEVVVNAGGTMQMLGGRAGRTGSTETPVNQVPPSDTAQKLTENLGGARGKGAKGGKGSTHTAQPQSAPQPQWPEPGNYPPPPQDFDDPIPF